MSVPSLKMTVTCERPNLLSERISSSSGSPNMASSTGSVICRSTSSGLSAGASVLIWTCTFVTSGTASIGRRSIDQTPTPMSSPVSARTSKRFLSAKAIMDLMVSSSMPVLADLALGELGAQREGARNHDPVAGVELRAHFHAAVVGYLADLDRLRAEFARLVTWNEDDLPSIDLLHRTLRYDHLATATPNLDRRGSEHPRLEHTIRVWNLHPCAYGPALRVQDVAQVDDPPRESAPRVGGRDDLHRLVHGHASQVALKDVQLDPDA